MEEEIRTKPPGLASLMRGRLQKVCGPLNRYGSRTVELLEDGYLYIFIDGMSDPQSRISIPGCIVGKNSDSPHGFTLFSADKKQKFICSDAESKGMWLEKISGVMNTNDVTATPERRRSVSARFVAIDRSGRPLIKGIVLKRSGIALYSTRWCEVWKGVGIAYAKSKNAANDDFKVIPLDDAQIDVNETKLRIKVTPSNGDEPTFIRLGNPREFERWVDVIKHEAGDDWITANHPDKPTAGAASDIESDEEIEIADLESDRPLRAVKVALELTSVSRSVNANVDTPGFESILEAKMMSMNTYGFLESLRQFEQRMNVPIYGPHGALHRHITALDIEAQKIRHWLCQLLDEYPREVKVALVAQQADALLNQYKKAREVYAVRRDIAEFRELEGTSGLRLGVNGTLLFLSDMCQKRSPAEATTDEIQRVEKVTQKLAEALISFRYDYDVFDDAVFTIEEIEKTLRETRAWIKETERAARQRSI